MMSWLEKSWRICVSMLFTHKYLGGGVDQTVLGTEDWMTGSNDLMVFRKHKISHSVPSIMLCLQQISGMKSNEKDWKSLKGKKMGHIGKVI